MPLKKKTVLLPMFLGVSLLASGCSATKLEHIKIKLDIPKELLTCKGKPTTPKGAFTQRDVAEYIARLKNAHGDCKRKLDKVEDLIEKQNK